MNWETQGFSGWVSDITQVEKEYSMIREMSVYSDYIDYCKQHNVILLPMDCTTV